MTEALTLLFQKYAHQGPGLQSNDLEEMKRNLATLAEFGVAEEEALATVESGIRRRLGLDQAPPPPPDAERTEPVAVVDLPPCTYSAARVRVVKLFEARHQKIHQTGLLGDASGVVRFVSWKGKSEPLTLKPGENYEIQGIYPTLYDDKISVNITNATATEIEEEIAVAPAPGEILVGAVTKIMSAGIVRRCPHKNCKKTVEVGPGGYLCPTHGLVDEPRPDLRARVVLDNGCQAATVYLPAPVVEKLTWLSLAGAVDLAESAKVGGDYLVEDRIRTALFGRYLKVYASPMSGQFFAQDVEVVKLPAVLHDTDPAAPWTLKGDPDWMPSVGTRAFIAELSAVREIVKDGEEKMSPTYAILPTGERAARFFWCGVLVELTKRDDSLVGRINDPTGTLRIKAHRQYQSRAYMTLLQVKAPALIAIAGKLNVYKPADSEDVYVSFVLAEVAQVDKATRLIWCEETLARGEKDSAIFDPVIKFLEEHGGEANE